MLGHSVNDRIAFFRLRTLLVVKSISWFTLSSHFVVPPFGTSMSAMHGSEKITWRVTGCMVRSSAPHLHVCIVFTTPLFEKIWQDTEIPFHTAKPVNNRLGESGSPFRAMSRRQIDWLLHHQRDRRPSAGTLELPFAICWVSSYATPTE